MTPRNKLATSAYAFNSATLNGFTEADFAAASGSANYIQNQSASPQAASFNISGTGRVGGAFTAASTSTFSGAMTVDSTATFRADSTTAFRLQNAGGSETLFTADTTNRLISIAGDLRVTASTNSASTFSVQNTASIPLFSVSSSEDRIYIGNPTPDGTGTLLVLDSKNTAGDPTGVNGAMYYSTTQNKMRCFENSQWKNCDTSKGVPTAQSANYTAADGDVILGNSTTASFTVTLPTPTPGATVTVKKVNAGNSITVTPSGGVQIDNLTSDVITTQWLSQDYFSDGTKWYRV